MDGAVVIYMVFEYPANSVRLLIDFPDHVVREPGVRFGWCLIHVPLLAQRFVLCLRSFSGIHLRHRCPATGSFRRTPPALSGFYSARHSAMRQNAGVEQVTTLNDVRR